MDRSHVKGGWCALAAAIVVVVSGAIGLVQAAKPAATSENAVLSDLRLIESNTPVRQVPSWKPPKKIVVSAMYGLGGNIEELRKVAPGVEIVLVKDRAETLAAVADADAYIGACDPAVIVAAKHLFWIQTGGAGVEHCVTRPEMRQRKILLTNAQHVEAPIIAEHVLALMFGISRGFPVWMPAQAAGHWARANAPPIGTPTAAQSYVMEVIDGKTMLVVGLGGIGTEVAKRAHALGMRVIATRHSGHDGPDFVSYVGLPGELLTLAKDADVIVNATPLTGETKGMFNAKFFDILKRTAIFINVGRGGSVVTSDLVDALKSKKLAGAGLDVTDPEPLPDGHPLFSAPNVIITPHVATRADVPRERMEAVVKENVRRYVAGDKMLSVVDQERGY
jgi:phosphoglycerate dehydrogenase-like enzyme